MKKGESYKYKFRDKCTANIWIYVRKQQDSLPTHVMEKNYIYFHEEWTGDERFSLNSYVKRANFYTRIFKHLPE